MKSLFLHMMNMLEVLKSRILTILIAGILPIISPLAFADGGTWSLDSASSSAQLYQGSTANPESVNGVARVTGIGKFDKSDLGNSVFDLSIYSADEQWGHALSPQGTLPAGYVADATDHTLLTFHSERILRMKDGTLQVIGDLTLTSVERRVTLTPSEAYAGPVYRDDPVIQTKTREVSFLFPNLSTALSSGSVTPIALNEKGALDVSASARVRHEDFPELLTAIRATNWPTVVKDEQCQSQSTIGGEGYAGPTCTGTVIAMTHQDSCQMTMSVGGEGYSGPLCTPPASDETTIALHLKLLRAISEPATATVSGSTATR